MALHDKCIEKDEEEDWETRTERSVKEREAEGTRQHER
jgi:hypothetical protein